MRIIHPPTFIDEQNEEDAEARRLILGNDPLDFAHITPLAMLPSDAPPTTLFQILRTMEVPRDGDAVRMNAGDVLTLQHYGSALVNRWILNYGLRVSLYPIPVPAPTSTVPLAGVLDEKVPPAAPEAAKVAAEAPAKRPVGRPAGSKGKKPAKGAKGAR